MNSQMQQIIRQGLGKGHWALMYSPGLPPSLYLHMFREKETRKTHPFRVLWKLHAIGIVD